MLTDEPIGPDGANPVDASDRISDALRQFLEEAADEEIVVYHGFDDCVIGLAEQFTNGPVLVYDRERVIDTLMRQGMDEAEAEEYFAFNVAGAWVGERTPIFLTRRYQPPLPGISSEQTP